MIPKRHAATSFDLFEPERRAINQLLVGLRAEIVEKDPSVGERFQHRDEQRTRGWPDY